MAEDRPGAAARRAATTFALTLWMLLLAGAGGPVLAQKGAQEGAREEARQGGQDEPGDETAGAQEAAPEESRAVL
ncbi:MAG: hypothetical protein PVG07_09605, partial [Acidobacteriota bacterium]